MEYANEWEKKLMKYVTLQATDINKFDELVNKALSMGWNLYGDPYIHDGFCQAVILKQEEKK